MNLNRKGSVQSALAKYHESDRRVRVGEWSRMTAVRKLSST